MNNIDETQYLEIMDIAEKRHNVLTQLNLTESDVDKVVIMCEFLSLCDKLMSLCDNDTEIYNLYCVLYKYTIDDEFEKAIFVRDKISSKTTNDCTQNK